MQPADGGVRANLARRELVGAINQHGRQRRRHPQVEDDAHDRAAEPAWRDADDGEGAVVDTNGLADDVRRPGKPRLPEFVRDHDHRLASRPRGVRRLEETAGRGMQPEAGEIVAGNEEPERAFELRGHADVERRGPERDDVLKRRQALLKVAKFAPRHARKRSVFALRFDELKLMAVRNRRQRLQHARLDPREHRGVGADPDPHRSDDDSGDSGHPPDGARGIPQVSEPRHQ